MQKQPRYLDIRQAIADRIRSGAFPVGSRLPSREALMSEFGVTRVTVDRAVRALLDSGVLVSRRRGGTTVEGAIPPIRTAIMTRFMPRADGIKPESENFYALFHGLFEYGHGINWEVIQPDLLMKKSKAHEKYDVVIVVRPRPGVLEEIKLPRRKLIVINRYLDSCRCSSTDHRGAARRMTRSMLTHFAERGHFFFDQPEKTDFVIDERRQGFIEACAERKSFYLINTGKTPPPLPDAGILVVFCPHAGRATELIGHYTGLGKVFGRDFICYDFDNFSAAPPVPTAIQDYSAMGQAAVEMILHPGSPAEHRIFMPEFRNFENYGIPVQP
jgi:hypothetical protein